MINKICAACCILLLSMASLAETMYVSDVVYVPIRSGAGNEYRVVHSGLKSGTQLTVLEAPENSEWTHIRAEGGINGWVRSQHLTPTPTARIVLGSTEAKLTQSVQKAETLQQQLDELQEAHRQLSEESSQQIQDRDSHAEELKKIKALSADAISLDQRHQDLLTKHNMIQTEVDAIRAENDRLKSDQTMNQWLFGAALVVLGMLLMLVLPALKPPKRNTDWAN